MPGHRIPPLNEVELQAQASAGRYFKAAVEAIDDQFGEGYAKAHPALIGLFMQTCAQEYASGVSRWYLADSVEAINGTLGRLVEAVSELRADD